MSGWSSISIFFRKLPQEAIHPRGALSTRKKCDIQQNLLFKIRDGKDLKNWNIAIFVISGVLGFFTRFGRPFHYIVSMSTWQKIWKRQSPQKLVEMSELNSHDKLKTGLPEIFLWKPKKKPETLIAEICGNIAIWQIFQPFPIGSMVLVCMLT